MMMVMVVQASASVNLHNDRPGAEKNREENDWRRKRTENVRWEKNFGAGSALKQENFSKTKI